MNCKTKSHCECKSLWLWPVLAGPLHPKSKTRFQAPVTRLTSPGSWSGPILAHTSLVFTQLEVVAPSRRFRSLLSTTTSVPK
eukprot:6582191-Prymnesium_polylepis.1